MRRIDWRFVAALPLLALLIYVIVEIGIAGNNAPPIPRTQPITLRGGRVNGNRISSKSWTFEYKHAQLSPDGTIASVDGVRNGILYKKGKPYLSIAAEHVQVNTQTFDFTATGDVHVEQLHPKDGVKRSFDTDLVQWINATKSLALPHPSIVRSNDRVLKVASISVDFNTDTVHFGRISGGALAP